MQLLAMFRKKLVIAATASMLSVLLIVFANTGQPIAQAQEEPIAPVEQVVEDTYKPNTYAMELPVMPESYPVRLYAKIDGITGGVNVTGHEGEFEIRNYFFNTFPDESSLNEDGIFSELTILKMSDVSTPDLIAAAGNLEEFDTILLSTREAGASVDSLQVLFVDTQLKTLRHTSQSDDWYYQPGWTWEEMTFTFDKIIFKYQEIDSEGNPVGEPAVKGWDTTAKNEIVAEAWNSYLTWDDDLS
jgi:type VI protein secretion system component Hcp